MTDRLSAPEDAGGSHALPGLSQLRGSRSLLCLIWLVVR